MDDIITGYYSDAGTNFWNYSSSNLTATALKTLANSTTLYATNPIVTNALSTTLWLYGWQPQMAPNILSNPVNQSVTGSGALTLTAYATGIPTPSYQWLKNGNPLSSQTSATLAIASANVNDAGAYSVLVSNVAGTATSTSAAVTVGNTAPTLGVIADQTVNVGVPVNLNVSALATDPDVPPQTLAFSLSSGPANATIDPGTGAFSLRPTVGEAGATLPITVAVTDNGSPNLSASRSFNVIVNPLTQPDVTSAAWTAGQLSLAVGGQLGPDYAVQASTNLVNWDTLFRTNSPAMPFQWSDPDSATFTMRFYRIIVGPPLP